MGRELQKKKKRSSTNKVRMKPKSKKVNPLGNAIIAANWYATTSHTRTDCTEYC
jgi:nucleolar protein 16